METRDFEKKFCEECRFFKQHYAIADDEFYATTFGHCSSNIACRDKKRFMERHNTACKHWQPIADLLIERKEILRDTLHTLSERIKEIAIIIEHDNYYR